MSKFSLLIVSLFAALCAMPLYAGQPCRLTVEQIFALADQNSKSIAAQTSALGVAAEAVREARSQRLPDIDVSLSASYLGNGNISDRDFSNGMCVKMPHWGNNFAIEASQLIYGGGVVSNSVALAKLSHEMASVELASSRSRVRFMLLGFYLDLSKLRNVLQVYDSHIALADRLISEIRLREREGIAIKNDITRFELRKKSLELERLRVKNTLEILNSDLVEMLALPLDSEIIPDDEMLHETLPIHDEQYWQQLAQGESFALQQSELAVRMSERELNIARSERIPKIALVAGNHFDGPITIEVPVINKNFNYWYVGLGVSFRLSSLYKADKTVSRARMAIEHSRRRYDEAAEQTTLKVKSDYIRYVESYEEVATLEKSLVLANENYYVVDNRYRNDVALTTDMIDAANARLDAELRLVNARIGVMFGYYRLQHTVGNL